MAKLIVVAAALCCAAHAQAQEAARSSALQQLIKDAQKEGELNLLLSAALGESEGVAALQTALNKAYGINVKLNYTPGPAMTQVASRIVQEVEAGRPPSSDLYVGIEVTVAEMIAHDVLKEVPWGEYFPRATGEAVQSGNRALLVTTLFNGVTYNARYVPDDKIPHKMADMFRPEWKGKIASTPYAVSFDRLALKRGFDVMKPILEKTAQWSSGLIRCGEAERIATGEFYMLFLDCGLIDPKLMRENGGPLGHVVLDDAATTSLIYSVIPKTSPHPNLAALLSGFLLTDEAQAILDKYQHATSHLVPGTPANAVFKSLQASGSELLALTPDDLQAHQKELLDYKKAFEKILAGK
ncbi:MAG TPA: extracellular solute-binding protein [Alphaproteobacteria bacterium]